MSAPSDSRPPALTDTELRALLRAHYWVWLAFTTQHPIEETRRYLELVPVDAALTALIEAA
jgi:hypothetical protein